MQAVGDFIRLPLSPHRGRMGRQVARRGNQNMNLLFPLQQLCLPECSLYRLNRMEIPILPQQKLAQFSQYLLHLATTTQVLTTLQYIL